MKIKINASDRIFVTGRTGSGKSVLMKQLLIPNIANYVIYDYKHEITLPRVCSHKLHNLQCLE